MKYDNVDKYVFPITLNDTPCWVKRKGEDKRNILRISAAWLAQRFTLFKALEVRSALAPQQRFDLELNHLKQFADLGLSVPELVEATNDYFITKAAGSPLNGSQPFPAKALLCQAFQIITAFHQADVIHGRPAMRDILVNAQGKLTFIDLEESRCTKSRSLKSRDITLLLLDSYRLKGISQATRVNLLRQWVQETGCQECQYWLRLLRWYRRLHWLPKLILRFKNNRLSKQILLSARVLEKTVKDNRDS